MDNHFSISRPSDHARLGEFRPPGDSPFPVDSNMGFPRSRHLPRIGNLGAEILEMESFLRGYAGPDVDLEVACSPCQGDLDIDAQSVLIILLKLIANSIEAMFLDQSRDRPRRKYIRICCQLRNDLSFPDFKPGIGYSDKAVLLTIRDNGPGIAPEVIPRIFAGGFSTRERVSEYGIPEKTPWGFGLTIAKELIEDAAGSICVVSAFRVGTRVDINFPVRLENNGR
jgi:signal transduction histidine kinase